MRTTLILFFISLSIFSFAQVNVDSLKRELMNADSIKKIQEPDSLIVYNDTLIFKIPSGKLHALQMILAGNEDGISVAAWKDMVAILNQQAAKQTYKKPVKK